MARLAALLALLALAVAVAIAAEAPAASPKPSKSSILTPYAAAPPTSEDVDAEAPSTDAVEDSEAAPIGAPSSNYPPIDSEFDFKSSASFLGMSFAATASAAAAGYFLF